MIQVDYEDAFVQKQLDDYRLRHPDTAEDRQRWDERARELHAADREWTEAERWGLAPDFSEHQRNWSVAKQNAIAHGRVDSSDVEQIESALALKTSVAATWMAVEDVRRLHGLHCVDLCLATWWNVGDTPARLAIYRTKPLPSPLQFEETVYRGDY